MSDSIDVTQQSRSSKKRVSRELSSAVADKTSGSWQAIVNCLAFFAFGLAGVGAAGSVAVVVVFAFAVTLLRFSLGVPACAYSTDLPIGHFNQPMTSGAGAMEVPTQGRKCNMPAMNACFDEEVWRFAPIEEEQRVQECVRGPENDTVVDVRRREIYSLQLVEAAWLLEGSVMRPRFLPRILIRKQALVQLLDETKEGLGVASFTSARD